MDSKNIQTKNQINITKGYHILTGQNFYLFFYFLNIYLFLRERERQSMSEGGAERVGDTESKAGSRLWVVSTKPDVGLELSEIMTWAEVRPLTDWAIQAPLDKNI